MYKYTINCEIKLIIIISERRREKWREASRRSSQRASFYSHMGKQSNIITYEIFVLTMWFIEQKVILFRCRTDILDEPALPELARAGPTRPWRYLTAYFSDVLKDINLKLLRNVDYDLKTVESNFHRGFFIGSEVIAFCSKTDFCHFYIHFCV